MYVAYMYRLQALYSVTDAGRTEQRNQSASNSRQGVTRAPRRTIQQFHVLWRTQRLRLRRGQHHVAFGYGGNLICFPVSHVYFFVGGVKVYSQTGWGRGRTPQELI